MKHTPGPWKVTEDRTRVQTMDDATDYQIADCEDTCFAPSLYECEANTRLIAAAPELLEILRDIVTHGPLAEYIPRETLKRARQIIAKAEGK